MKTRHVSRSIIALACATAMIGTTSCVPLDRQGFDASQPELFAFNSCGELTNYLRGQALLKSEWMQSALSDGVSYDPMGFSSSPSTTSFDTNTGEPVTTDTSPPDIPVSETNLQESGVDEADIFKADPTHAFALHGQRLVIIGAIGTEVPEPDPGTEPDPNDPPAGTLQIEDLQVASEIDIPGDPFEMFLVDDRVVVMTRTTHGELKGTLSEDAPTRPDSTRIVKAVVVDVTDRGNPTIERQVAFEGEYVSSRRIDNQVYVVARGMLEGPEFSSPLSTDSTWLIERELAVRNARLDSWIPYTYDIHHANGTTESKVESADCNRTYASRASQGDDALGVYSFDVSNPQSELKSTTILGDGAIVYASRKSIVVALTNFAMLRYGDEEPETQSTDLFNTTGINTDFGFGTNSATENETATQTELSWIHRFELGADGEVTYQATGTVEGWLLDQFSMSEHRGYVRVATEVGQEDPTREVESMVHVLETRDKSGVLQAPQGDNTQFLDTVATLDGIGVDEDLYAARFQGDWGYLVTFRETDPLWVIDLKEPTEPKLRGHLMVPGYSTYLHPVGADHLLAVGRAGLNDGIKISLFDVSNPDNPTAVEERDYGSSSAQSEALQEHRAFRYITDKSMMLLPITTTSENGMWAWDVDLRTGFTERPVISHESVGGGDVRRAYRIGEYLYTFGSSGVVVSALDTLERVASVPL